MKLSQKRWRLLGTVAAVAVTTAAGGVAWAASNADPTPSASPSTPSQPNQNQKPGGGPGRGGFRGEFGLGGAVHGEFVVPKNGGGYQTVAVQRGQVTAVSNDSVTVKSADGYSRTYTLTSNTMVNAARNGIGDVKTGNTVNVSAVVTNGTATATRVNDGTVRQAAGQAWGFKHGPR
ncbi:hypothetical protein JOF29_004112 [Kribbella aluminosa]|uniref:DUF5666 domain-containing protein n=1 Tax=Kribbella aluminosa TaxID=416017 RepID=A0ABS4UN35_9ACTN|nr:hypothetical protein [Kribbella aluminosa]MBP2353029.1 hypothetical protein [Kribbella aluminosa]